MKRGAWHVPGFSPTSPQRHDIKEGRSSSHNLYGTAGRSLLTTGVELPRVRAEDISSRGAWQRANGLGVGGMGLPGGYQRGLLGGYQPGEPRWQRGWSCCPW